jgi:hypothetical protein
MSVGKKIYSNFAGYMNRGATDRKDGKVAIVTGGKRKVFAKTNRCCETPARKKPHDLSRIRMLNWLGHGHNRSLVVTRLVEIRLKDGVRIQFLQL